MRGEARRGKGSEGTGRGEYCRAHNIPPNNPCRCGYIGRGADRKRRVS